MGESTGISWTDATWNPWRGCKKISPGCKNCYMFAGQKFRGLNPEVVVKTSTWRDPVRWQNEQAAIGGVLRVFAASWSDWMIGEADLWRADAWRLVKETPNNFYQILTKRADRIQQCLPADWGDGYPNVALGVSVESNDYLWRMDRLREVPARVRFVSGEPLLEDISAALNLEGIDQFIVGGESGNRTHNFRPMEHQWARNIRDRCEASGTTFFFKQSAGFTTETGIELDGKIYHDDPAYLTAYRQQIAQAWAAAKENHGTELPSGGTIGRDAT